VAFDVEITEENGYLGFSLTEVGEYTVTVNDGCGNVYILSISIKEPETLTYDRFLTGFNDFVFLNWSEFFTIFKIPSIFIETTFTMVSTTTNIQRNSYS
jgi:hypothetical protein